MSNYKDMNIYASKGDKVKCITFDAGYEGDQETAKEYLEIEKVYTIEYTHVGDWHTKVYLQEFPNVGFNSVFFADVKKKKKKKSCKKSCKNKIHTDCIHSRNINFKPDVKTENGSAGFEGRSGRYATVEECLTVIGKTFEVKKYKERNSKIEAFQFLSDHFPDWFMDAVSENKIILTSVNDSWESVDAFMKIPANLALVKIQTEKGEQIALKNWFICKDKNGNIFPIDPESFKQKYELIQDDVSKETEKIILS